MMFRALAVIVFGLISTGWSAEPVKKVLFIGTDGTRWDALEAAQTPHLDALIAQGALSVGTEIIAPRETKGDTVSGPGWSNLLCGVWPDKHGSVDNAFKGTHYAEFPHFFARIKEARPTLQTASFSDWGPISTKILSHADESVGEDAHGHAAYVEADARLTKACVAHIREKNPDAVMLYLGQVDETGHAKGFHPKVPEYIAAIERVDGLIGEVVAAIKARPTFAEEDWLILIGTDHGGVGTGHGGGRQIPEIRRTFMILNGPSVMPGKIEEQTYQVDIVASALTHLGIALKPEWKLDGRAVGLKTAKP
ncbi:MAG: alkaline phosphatase family protein [Planctomycetaceae bacterium]|nr:alkaline phosphatase family protein [Planctomycetaceae bacterium]